MKYFVVSLVLIALCFVVVNDSASSEWVALFVDPGHSSCEFADNGGLVIVYIAHISSVGATNSKWMLDLGTLGWTHMGEILAQGFTSEGTALTGISVSYGGCINNHFDIMTITFFGSFGAPCTEIRIVASPDAVSGKIESVDCVGNLIHPSGGDGLVNPDGSCISWCTPIESRTWGQIKALYRAN